MFSKVQQLKDIPPEEVSKVTGMLIDMDILELEEIIEILNNNETLNERALEALEVINEDNN